jgi:hypothetical protein
MQSMRVLAVREQEPGPLPSHGLPYDFDQLTWINELQKDRAGSQKQCEAYHDAARLT